MNHTQFVNHFTIRFCITNDNNVKSVFISTKKLSKPAAEDFEMQLGVVIERFLIKTDDHFFVTFDEKGHDSDLAVPFAQWHTANGSIIPHFKTPAHKNVCAGQFY